MESPANIQYELNLDDLKAYLAYQYVKNPKVIRSQKLMLRICLPLSIFCLIMAILLAFSAKDIFLSIIVGIIAISGIFYSIYFVKFMLRIINQAANRTYGQKPSRVIGKHWLLISSDGMTDVTDIGQSTTRWNGIDWFASNEKYLFLVVRGSNFYIIPKNAFSNESSFNQFVETAKSYYQKDKSQS